MYPWLPLLFTFLVGLSWLCSITITLLFRNQTKKKSHYKLPPGPRGLPILGSLHKLGSLPHRALHQLAAKHGPIMHIRLGLVPAIVVSSAEAAQLFLKTHDAVFCSRPKIQASELISYGNKGVAFAEYGPYWRHMRKFFTLELLSNAKIEMFKEMRREEVCGVVEEIKGVSEVGGVVDLSEKVEKLIEDMTYKMIFGKIDGGLKFRKSVEEELKMFGAFNLNDFVPFLGVLDLQGLARQMKRISKDLDALFDKIIEEHMQSTKEKQGSDKDFINILLSLMESNNAHGVQLDLDSIKAILLDMLAAGMDTSATASLWALSELMKHPLALKKAQEELKDVIGLHGMVEETDLFKLEYLNMVIKETMRLHPVAPLLIPRESVEDVIVNDYLIPKKSRLIINAWAIGRDPNVWLGDPEEFNPSRFANSDIHLYGRNFELIPFGAGRRVCPGLQLGLRSIQLVLAQLLHCFNWELPDSASPCDLDMGEEFGLVVSRAKHLFAKSTYRLKLEKS